MTILPGSRTQEVEHNLRDFLKAARHVLDSVANVRLAIAAFKPHQAEMARRLVADAGLPVEVHVGRTPELIHLADCCMACSGSVSLELLYHRRPTVILYKISRLAYWVQQWFRKVKYITLVNLLAADDPFSDDLTPYDAAAPGADRVLFPEYLTWEDKSREIAGHVVGWLTDRPGREALVARLEELKHRVAHGGASRRAADYILERIGGATCVPAPHGPGRAGTAETRASLTGRANDE